MDATNSTCVITSPVLTDAGYYTVHVTGLGGSTSSTSTLDIAKATPVVTFWPTATSITYGQTLASSILSGGSASAAGNFALANPALIPSVGTTNAIVVFTPADVVNYSTASGTVSVRVNPVPDITFNHTGSTLCPTWPGGITLQAAPDLTGAFTNVPNATSPLIITNLSGPQCFYRLSVPRAKPRKPAHPMKRHAWIWVVFQGSFP